MAKRRYIQNDNNGNDDVNGVNSRRVVSINQKMICHVFESDEVRIIFLFYRQIFIYFYLKPFFYLFHQAQSIAHSIGQAFQVAYVEFLKANGIDDPSLTCDIDYQEVLEQQEIDVEELDRFAKKECQKEVYIKCNISFFYLTLYFDLCRRL